MDSRRWHDWCTCAVPGAPPPLTVEQWRALAGRQGSAHIDELERWISQCYFPTAQFDCVAEQLQRVLHRNSLTLPGAKEIAVITGPNTVGKSTFIKLWARQRYREWTAGTAQGANGQPVCYPAPDVECDLCPVVFINLQDDAQTKALDSAILMFFGLPSETTVHETTRSAMKAVIRHHVKIVVIDDVNLLKTEWRGARKVLDHIKHINTELGESGASLVLVGANLIGGGLLEDPQIKGRSKTFVVSTYDNDGADQDRAREWQRVLRGIENLLLPHLPAGRPGMLYRDLAGEMLHRTQGYLQDLSQLVRDATMAATRDGTLKITRKHLDGVRLSDRAEEERAVRTTRAKRLTDSGRTVKSQARATGTPAATTVITQPF